MSARLLVQGLSSENRVWGRGGGGGGGVKSTKSLPRKARGGSSMSNNLSVMRGALARMFCNFEDRIRTASHSRNVPTLNPDCMWCAQPGKRDL